MFSLFIELWKKRGPYSEISNTYLGDEPLSIFFHHILPKSKYPEAYLDQENIIILTPDEHERVEKDPIYYDKINKMRSVLENFYDRIDSKKLE